MKQLADNVFGSLKKWERELKLPKHSDRKGYDEHLPTHVRRMVLSIFRGG